MSGDPAPNIAWFHENRFVKPSEEFEQIHGDIDEAGCAACILMIQEVYPEDAGKYTVVAKNQYGAATCSAELTVKPGTFQPITT